MSVTHVTYSDCPLSGQTWSPSESPKTPREEQTPARSWSYNGHPACERGESETTQTLMSVNTAQLSDCILKRIAHTKLRHSRL